MTKVQALMTKKANSGASEFTMERIGYVETDGYQTFRNGKRVVVTALQNAKVLLSKQHKGWTINEAEMIEVPEFDFEGEVQ